MADDLTGKLDHLVGKVKEGVGDLLGDRQIEREGRLDQMEGRGLVERYTSPSDGRRRNRVDEAG